MDTNTCNKDDLSLASDSQYLALRQSVKFMTHLHDSDESPCQVPRIDKQTLPSSYRLAKTFQRLIYCSLAICSA